jgi:hypothetical protein
MKNLLLIISAACSIAFLPPVFAQVAADTKGDKQVTVVAPSPSAMAPVAVGATAPGSPVIVSSQAAQPYSFDAGTVMASFVNWLWVAFGGTIVTALALIAQKVLRWLGVQTNQAMNDRLMEAIRNGMNDAAAKAQTDLTGKFPIEVKNQIIAQGIEYAKAHQAATITALGLDPKTGEATEALRAKAETVIIDPMQPTNPGLVANPADDTAKPLDKSAA